MFKRLLEYFTKQFIKDVGRRPQTTQELMSIQNEVVRYINLTKGKGITGSVRTSAGDVKPIADPFQGFKPTVIQGGKSKEGIGTLLKDSPEAIAKMKADNKAAVERLKNKRQEAMDDMKNIEDPEDMASGGRIGYGNGLKVYPKIDITETGQTPAEGIDVRERDITVGGTGVYQGDNLFAGAEKLTGNVKVDVTAGGETLFKDTLSKDDALNYIIGLGEVEGDKFQIKSDDDFDNVQIILKKKFNQGGIAGQLHLNEGGRVPMIFGGSAGLKGVIASIKAQLNKGRKDKLKTLFPKYSVEEKELLKLGEKYLPNDAANLAAKEAAGKAEGVQTLIDRIKHDKKLIAEQAKNKAKNDPNLDFLMESLEKTMPEAYGPHLKKYKNIDKDILQLETIKKNLLTKDRKLHASGGRAGSGLNYLLGEDDQNVRMPSPGGLPGLLGE